MRVIRSPVACVRAVCHLFDTEKKLDTREKAQDYSASICLWKEFHYRPSMRTCSRRAMCRILSLVVTLTRSTHKNDVDGMPRIETRLIRVAANAAGYRSRVLPHLVSFLLHPSFRRCEAILHVRLGHARVSRCHPLSFLSHCRSTVNAFLFLFYPPLHLQSSSLSLPFLLITVCFFLLSVDHVSKHRSKEANVAFNRCSPRCLDPVKNGTSQLSVIIAERRCASPTAVRRHGNLHT